MENFYLHPRRLSTAKEGCVGGVLAMWDGSSLGGSGAASAQVPSHWDRWPAYIAGGITALLLYLCSSGKEDWDLLRVHENREGQALGDTFVEFQEHKHALRTLHHVNNNSENLWVSEEANSEILWKSKEKLKTKELRSRCSLQKNEIKACQLVTLKRSRKHLGKKSNRSQLKTTHRIKASPPSHPQHRRERWPPPHGQCSRPRLKYSR